MEKAVGLVIRGTDWSESSRIVTIFTREFGKVRGLAKGGRRLRSQFETSLDLLNVCQIVFIHKHHGGLDLLTEARLQERFSRLRSDLAALYMGYYIAELLADGTQDFDPHPTLYDFAVGTLRQSDLSRDQSPDTLSAVSRFELVWLQELGYSPRLDVCVFCGQAAEVGASEPPRYSVAAGGLVCPNCFGTAADGRRIHAESWAALGQLAGGSSPLQLQGIARREVRQLLGQTVSFVLGRRPRLLAYIDKA